MSDNRIRRLVRGFVNPHDALHLLICLSICTGLHFILEWVL